MEILNPKTNKKIGIITSGTFSPILNQPIAMGYVESEFATLKTWICWKQCLSPYVLWADRCKLGRKKLM